MSAESGFRGDRMVLMPPRKQARVWVRDGVPTLTIITDVGDDFSASWPEGSGPLLVFDSSFDVSITVVP